MLLEMNEIKPGMRVWSGLLIEYFTVESIACDDRIVTLREGIFAMSGFPHTLVEVKNEY